MDPRTPQRPSHPTSTHSFSSDDSEAEDPPHHDRPIASSSLSKEEICRDDAALAAMLQDLEIRRSQARRFADGNGNNEEDEGNSSDGVKGIAQGKSILKKTRFGPHVGKAGSAP
jgi:hypothetical protein